MVLSGGRVVSNASRFYGGGMYISGGTATLSGGQILSNTADLGGGVYVGLSTARLVQDGTASAIVGNYANVGGGIYVYQGTATLNGAQVVGNTSGTSGSGIYNHGGVLILVNSTLSGNESRSGAGGGLCDDPASSWWSANAVAGVDGGGQRVYE